MRPNAKSSINLEKNVKGFEQLQKIKLSNKEIAKGLQKCDESVLGYIYDQHVEDLFRFGCQFTSDRDLVLDCIHEIFVSLIIKSNQLKNIHSLKSYLFTAVYRRIIYQLKREKIFESENQNQETHGFDIEFSAQTRLIIKESNLENRNQINQAIKKLSRKQRQAILLYYYDGFLQEEIAMIMGLKNVNSVTKLISRALQAIRRNIKKITILILAGIMQISVQFF